MARSSARALSPRSGKDLRIHAGAAERSGARVQLAWGACRRFYGVSGIFRRFYAFFIESVVLVGIFVESVVFLGARASSSPGGLAR